MAAITQALATKRLRCRIQLLGNRTGQRRLLPSRMQRCYRLDQCHSGLLVCRSIVTQRHEARQRTRPDAATQRRHRLQRGQCAAIREGRETSRPHVMRVPGKLSLHLRDLNVLIVDLPHHSRRPKFAKSGACTFERDRGLLNLSCRKARLPFEFGARRHRAKETSRGNRR